MKKLFVLLGIFAIPVVAGAQLGNVQNIIGQFGNIISMLIPIAFALALLFFFYGLARFILAAGDEEKREQGKSIMIWGVVALFVMASVWGIVRFIGDAFGIQQGNTVQVPNVPGI